MNVKISHTASVQKFLEEASGLLNDAGDPRVKALVYRILRDSVNIIEDLAVTPEEFWKAVNYLNVLGARQEAGLVVAGLGLEHYLDLLARRFQPAGEHQRLAKHDDTLALPQVEMAEQHLFVDEGDEPHDL